MSTTNRQLYPNEQYYIGSKRISAWPATNAEVARLKNQPMLTTPTRGYAVQYPDGYLSWSPKDVFEKASLPMGQEFVGTEKEVVNINTITEKMVKDFIADIQVVTMGPKTTVMSVTLQNGFVITESSSCVDAVNYNENTGRGICMNRIETKVWELLGFLLQTAINGVK